MVSSGLRGTTKDTARAIRLIFIAAAGSNAQITQGDIDLAIESLQAVPILER